ncbi:preprotein translocase subunit TatB [Erythrobacter longus]|uniref:Sec-independent protein translocase protein TatB n=1 Tax=Erythrobacter longus TaxID=1044 RepID=A0A074M6I6_ERYLO|nr:Sec-independent protein translocase protein TatB [Erythrobacter longus]KEO90366.1 preprotein translocase subunit TatB [Erythrobacter longus]
MFDIGAAELLVIIIVAVLVIGPKDMPLAMRHAGRWIGKVRRVSSHFRTGIDAMVREAELEDMEKKWKAQNEEIMKRSAAQMEAEKGEPVMTGPPPVAAPAADAQSAVTETATSVEPVPAPTKPKTAEPTPPETPAKPKE